ncbi:hypothetical protein [Staphylococcus chromogenes]|uniref:hypothetical protein n=1 Tax=Staphylococcus chromogenes TaxID=46126 RepID=UPI000D1AF96A|nr:hypothetical protein [Staphylococcus chromogenes]PTG33708.1 hypothetical protein BU634_05350 [Staphylococcus chromogenes]RIM30191.1 hypothetical protein BU652_06620 [Staphylococcus chromogenes]
MVEMYYGYEGTPYLVMNIEDLNNLPSDVTKTPPPNGIYRPFYYDSENDTWHGSDESEFLRSVEEEKEVIPITSNDEVILSLTQKVAEQELKIDSLEDTIAMLLLKNAELGDDNDVV